MDASSWLDSQYYNEDGVKPFQFMLADAGYDVYLASNRGTTYSRGHKRYNSERRPEKYWDFSWAEMGLYDDKAFIKFAVDQSSLYDKAFFIGY